MNKKILLCLTLIMLGTGSVQGADRIPRQIGNLVLGGRISECRHMLKPDSVMAVRYLECQKEVEITAPAGFKSGMVYYGTCTGDERILRIKLKYEDSSARFYDELLVRFRERFGEPDEWQGDPFHVVVAWKWYFTDKDGSKISMILQHNTRDQEQKIGNSLKLTHSTLLNAEESCFRSRQKPDRPENTEPRTSKGNPKPDWDDLLPR